MAEEYCDIGDGSLFVKNLQFFVYDSAESFFKNIIAVRYVFSESFIDEGLITSTPSIFDLLTEPIKEVCIDANRDTSFAGR